MKRMLKIISLLLVFAFALPILTSCGPFDTLRAALTIDRAIKKIDKLDSYTNTTSITTSFRLNGSAVSLTAQNVTLVEDLGSKDFKYKETITTTTEVGRVRSATTTTNGYEDGNAYFSIKSSDGTSELKSTLSADEYLEYIAEMAEIDDDFEIKTECSSIESEKFPTGARTYTLSGMTDDSLETYAELLRSSGAYIDTDDYPILDVKITVNVSKKKLLNTINYEYIFGNSKNNSGATGLSSSYLEKTSSTPTFIVRTDYTDHGTTVIEPTDLDKYTAINDVRDIGKIKKVINEEMSKESGEFEHTTHLYLAAGYTPVFKNQTVSVNYYEDEDGFTCYVDDQKLGDKNTSDAEKRAAVCEYIDSGNFSSALLTGISTVEIDGAIQYTATAKSDSSTLMQGLSGAEETSFSTVTFKIWIRDGEIESYEYAAIGTTKLEGVKISINIKTIYTPEK